MISARDVQTHIFRISDMRADLILIYSTRATNTHIIKISDMRAR